MAFELLSAIAMRSLRVSVATVVCLSFSCASQPLISGPEGARSALCGDAADCTVELELQSEVEEELDRLMRDANSKRAVIVVVDPTTGAVRAMGGRDGKTSVPWLAAIRAVDPGSVMKTFSLAAAIDEGVVNETTKVMGEGGKWRVNPKELITDRVAHGEMSVEDVLVFSSNVGAAKITQQLGAAPLKRLFDAVRLTDDVLPQMRKGMVPSLENDVTLMHVGLGADVEVTPLQLTSAISVFADEGRFHPLTMTQAGQRSATQAVKSDTAVRMQRLLAQTIARDDGTGSKARVKGRVVAGKTGTWAMHGDAVWANFVGFIPGERAVVFVGIETTAQGYSGGTIAAPSAARILTNTH